MKIKSLDCPNCGEHIDISKLDLAEAYRAAVLAAARKIFAYLLALLLMLGGAYWLLRLAELR